MKLYNIYENLILENNTARINQAIKDRKAVNLWYEDAKGEITKRYGFIYSVGRNKKNDIIRFFQAAGGGTSGEWKTLRVDRIKSIDVTNFTFYKPPNELSGSGNIPAYPGKYGTGNDGSMSGGVSNYVKFNNDNNEINK